MKLGYTRLPQAFSPSFCSSFGNHFLTSYLYLQHTGTVDPTDALAHTQVSKEETNTEVTGLARAGQFFRL